MRSVLTICAMALMLSVAGCGFWARKALPVAEVEPQLVVDCRLLAVLNETAQADDVIQWSAAREMIARIKQRAVQLGATHLVWHHRTKTSASASVYYCPFSSMPQLPETKAR